MNIVITGASGALGQAVLALCQEQGHAVAAIDAALPAPSPSPQHSPSPDPGVIRLQGDLGNPETAQALLAQAARELGGIDALVHLVGGFAWIPTLSSTPADWQGLFSDNVLTALSCAQAASGHMAPGGSIVCVGAAAAQRADAGMAAYAAAKSGVHRLVEALAIELRPQGLRINAVLPSIMDTPRNRADMPDADFSAWTTTRAVAETILFLCAPASRAINGASIPVTNNA